MGKFCGGRINRGQTRTKPDASDGSNAHDSDKTNAHDSDKTELAIVPVIEYNTDDFDQKCACIVVSNSDGSK